MSTAIKDTSKTEKLVTAIYMITSFFDEKEPMKWRLRELGNGLLSSHNPEEFVPAIMSLLTVAKHAGLISDMNFEIVYKQFSSLLTSSLALEDIFKKTDSVEGSNHTEVAPGASEKPSLYIASSIRTDVPAVPAENHPIETAPEVKEPIVESATRELLPAIKDTYSIDAKKPLKDFGLVAVKKNSRQSVIINILKRKKEIMIKDVSPLIDGVSEKTIQRELLTMVKAGILTKVGEKRWSRYSLAE